MVGGDADGHDPMVVGRSNAVMAILPKTRREIRFARDMYGNA